MKNFKRIEKCSKDETITAKGEQFTVVRQALVYEDVFYDHPMAQKDDDGEVIKIAIVEAKYKQIERVLHQVAGVWWEDAGKIIFTCPLCAYENVVDRDVGTGQAIVTCGNFGCSFKETVVLED